MCLYFCVNIFSFSLTAAIGLILHKAGKGFVTKLTYLVDKCLKITCQLFFNVLVKLASILKKCAKMFLFEIAKKFNTANMQQTEYRYIVFLCESILY